MTILTNEYDGNHHRIRKVVNGGDTFDYYYNDKWQLLTEAKNGNAYALYVWHLYYIDALAVRMRAADMHYFLHDANFNVTGVVNDSAAVLERYSYTPYGEVTFLEPDFDPIAGNETAIGNNYLYTGRERDPVTALYNYRSRFYHAPLGRFTSRDWIGYDGGMNLYGYVRNRPAIGVDPYGLQTLRPPTFSGIPAFDGRPIQKPETVVSVPPSTHFFFAPDPPDCSFSLRGDRRWRDASGTWRRSGSGGRCCSGRRRAG